MLGLAVGRTVGKNVGTAKLTQAGYNPTIRELIAIAYLPNVGRQVGEQDGTK